MKFKKDADGAAAVGSETSKKGLLQSGKKVSKGKYRLTFKNEKEMMKFMDKYEKKLTESTTPDIDIKHLELDNRLNELLRKLVI